MKFHSNFDFIDLQSVESKGSHRELVNEMRKHKNLVRIFH